MPGFRWYVTLFEVILEDFCLSKLCEQQTAYLLIFGVGVSGFEDPKAGYLAQHETCCSPVGLAAAGLSIGVIMQNHLMSPLLEQKLRASKSVSKFFPSIRRKQRFKVIQNGLFSLKSTFAWAPKRYSSPWERGLLCLGGKPKACRKVHPLGQQRHFWSAWLPEKAAATVAYVQGPLHGSDDGGHVPVDVRMDQQIDPASCGVPLTNELVNKDL